MYHGSYGMVKAKPSKRKLKRETERQEAVQKQKAKLQLLQRAQSAALVANFPKHSAEAVAATKAHLKKFPEVKSSTFARDVANARAGKDLSGWGAWNRCPQEVYDEIRALKWNGEDGEDLDRRTFHVRLQESFHRHCPTQKPLSKTLSNEILNECGIGRDMAADHIDDAHARAGAARRAAISYLAETEAIVLYSDESAQHNTDTCSFEAYRDGKGAEDRKAAKTDLKRKKKRKNRGGMCWRMYLQFGCNCEGHQCELLTWYNFKGLKTDMVVMPLADFTPDCAPDTKAWLIVKRPETPVVRVFMFYFRHCWFRFATACRAGMIRAGWSHPLPPRILLKLDGDPKLLMSLLILLGENPLMSEAGAKRVRTEGIDRHWCQIGPHAPSSH
jgi:hypothetical protein